MVGELEFGAAIACCVNIRVRRLELLVDLDSVIDREFNVGLL